MTDLHTHILPGMDDGARTAAEAGALLRAAAAQGVARVALTPHYYGRERSVDDFLAARGSAMARLAGVAPPELELKAGAEVYLCSVVAEEQLARLRMDNTVYLLVELPYRALWDSAVYMRLDKLVRIGLKPIVAHVERYATVRRDDAAADKLLSGGCLIQVNADSVLSDDRVTMKLLKHGRIQLLASDVHDERNRASRLAAAYDRIAARLGAAAAERLRGNADAVWEDRSVAIDF